MMDVCLCLQCQLSVVSVRLHRDYQTSMEVGNSNNQLTQTRSCDGKRIHDNNNKNNIIFPLRKRIWAQSIMLRKKKKKKEESRTKKQLTHRRCLSCMRPQMADNRNPCSEATVAVGAREGLTISMC